MFMAQHFLLSRPAKTLTLAQVVRMTDAEAETMFRQVRWPDTDGAPICPMCGGLDAYECRRPNGALRFRCRACKKDFSITSGTLFHSAKMPLRSYLLAVAIFCNEVKGKSMLALSRDLGMSYKNCFMLAHKLREAMASELKGRAVGGEGKEAEVDSAYFGGYVRPANRKEDRVDRRFLKNQSGKRKAVIVIRERGGNTLPAVFPTEGASLASRWLLSRPLISVATSSDTSRADNPAARHTLGHVANCPAAIFVKARLNRRDKAANLARVRVLDPLSCQHDPDNLAGRHRCLGVFQNA